MGYAIGMKNIPKPVPRGTNCPNCMIGKCQRRDLPSARKFGTTAPLEQVNWDLMMVNEISIEGYRYAIIFTDSFTRVTTLSRARAALPGTDDHAAHPFRISSASQLNRVNDAAPAPPEPEPRMPPGLLSC